MRLGYYRHYYSARREWPERDAFIERHTGPGHGIEHDQYRAPCRPLGGCRNCGAPPAWPKRFYCSDACRVEFEADHFWGSARHRALTLAMHDGRARCARCHESTRGWPEVNHIVPVNGSRYHFGCQNHQSNLEVLCHRCHVEVTAEQRAAGLITM
jgi:hypothetical protein